jgi:tRNA (guanine37-N1)-methyltransferase
MVLIETISRLIPGVLGNEDSICYESFSEYLLDAPQYTRPREFEGIEVPEILLSGNHAEIEKWRKEKAIEATKERRSDLLVKYFSEYAHTTNNN